MSAASQVDWGANVPIFDPTGELRAIPQQHVQEALADPAARRAVPMVDPQGEHHWVGEDAVRDAVAAGGKISFPSKEMPKWFGFTPGNVASNVWTGVKGVVGGTIDLAEDLANNPNWFEGSGSTYQKFIGQPAEEQVVKAGQALNEGHPTEAAGHALASAVPLVGPIAANLGEQAGTGDVGGAVGQAAGMAAPAIVGPRLPQAIDNLIPSRARAAAHFNDFEAKYGEVPIDTARTQAKAQALTDRMESTKLQPTPPVVRQLLDRISGSDQPDIMGQPAAQFAAKHPEAYQKMVEQGIVQPNKPLSIAEARDFRTDLNTLIYDRNVPSQFKGYLKSTAQALHQDILDSLPNQSARDWYSSINNEWRKAEKVGAAGDMLGHIAGGMAGYEVGKSVGHPWAGAWIGHRVGVPAVGSMVDSMLDRTPTAPPSGDVIASRQAATAAIMAAAKNGEIAPGEMERRLKLLGIPRVVSPPPR